MDRINDTTGELFLNLFELNPAAIAISRVSDSILVNVNESFLKLFEFEDKRDVIGKTAVQLNLVVDTPAREQIIDTLSSGHKVINWQGSMRTRTGKIKFTTSSVIKIQISGTACMMAVIQDISDRKIAEEKANEANEALRLKIEQLRESEEKFNKAFHSSAAGITISRVKDGMFYDVNKAYERITGYTRDELINHTAHELQLISSDQRKLLAQKANDGGLLRFEVALRNKSGQIKEMLSSVDTVNIGGELFAIAISYDITDLKKTQNELQLVNKELESFSYSVSHDLRAPLRAIIGYTQIIEEDFLSQLPDALKARFSVIKKNAMKMGNLIDDLLEFSRLGKAEIIKTSLNMTDIVNSVLLDLSENNQSVKGVEIQPLLAAHGDAAMIKQVWVNLISNGLKYTRKKEKSKVEIYSYADGNDTVYAIRDNGAGFNMEYKEKLFGVFQRLHRESEFEGTGVGLALVKRIISRHDGKVWAEGKVDEGATFYFSLPNQTI